MSVLQLDIWEDMIVSEIEHALTQHESVALENHDELFIHHTTYVKFAADHAIPLRPVRLWEGKLLPMVIQSESRLQEKDPHARIHKGAPFFNVAICFFLAGDFDRAFQYFTEAGTEDELSGRGSRYLVPTGDNPLAERAIIRPLVQKLIPEWQRDFQFISSRTFDHAELKSLLAWLVQRAPDAFQTITALHRLRLLANSIDNEASRYQMVRTLADIVLAIESSLRRWQIGVEGQLHERTVELLKANPSSRTSFDTFHTDFTKRWPKSQRETAAAVNWVIQETFSRLARPTVAERIGIAAYLAVRLRNCLMHINEESLDIHNDRRMCFRVAGIVFAVLRISKHGNEHTLSSL